MGYWKNRLIDILGTLEKDGEQAAYEAYCAAAASKERADKAEFRRIMQQFVDIEQQ